MQMIVSKIHENGIVEVTDGCGTIKQFSTGNSRPTQAIVQGGEVIVNMPDGWTHVFDINGGYRVRSF